MLAPAGILGGLGTYVVNSFDGNAIKPHVTAHLAVIGLYVLIGSVFWLPLPVEREPAVVVPLGAFSGFADGVGGGWSPVVATGLTSPEGRRA